MAKSIHIFTWSMLFIGVYFRDFNIFMLYLNLFGYILLYKKFKVWSFTNKWPTTRSRLLNIPKTLLSNSAQSFHREINELWSLHGCDKFRTWIGTERFLVVSKLQDVKKILNSTDDGLLMENFDQMWPWLGGDDIKSSGFSSQGLVNALVDGPFSKLTQSDTFVKALNERVRAACQRNIREGVVDIHTAIKSLTFDVIYALAMGTESNNQRLEFFEAGEKLCQMADQRMYSGWKQNKWLRNVLGEEATVAKCRNVFAELVQRVLDEKRDKRARDVNCLLDVLLADGKLSQGEIVSTLAGFIVLGYDRLSSSTCSALMELAKSPESQQRIRRESKIPIESTKALQDMKSLDKLIRKTQRLSPAVPVVSKWITEGIPLNGFFIPPESSVLLYLEGTGRDASRLHSPNNLDENLSDTFGGQRHELNLPMTVMKAVLGNLLAKYRLRTEKENVEMGCGVSRRPTGARVSFNYQS